MPFTARAYSQGSDATVAISQQKLQNRRKKFSQASFRTGFILQKQPYLCSV
jgi:hypothetical protein